MKCGELWVRKDSGEMGCSGAGGVDWGGRKGIGGREKVGVKKRPSVETEGRLTIACHMKNLKRSMLLLPFSGHKDKGPKATE
jgi:hypothetical protein